MSPRGRVRGARSVEKSAKVTLPTERGVRNLECMDGNCRREGEELGCDGGRES